MGIKLTGADLPGLKQKVDMLGPKRFAARVAPLCVRIWRDHLQRLPNNKQGWKSTKFWEKAGRSIKYEPNADGFTLVADKIGLRQRLYGGVISAKKKKYLTIPAIEEAYGKTAREFHDLKFSITPRGPALVRREQTRIDWKEYKREKKRFAKKGGVLQMNLFAKTSAGDVVYWLRKRVTQKGNPNVLPQRQEIVDAIRKTVSKIVTT